jgi:hypothetical protein
LYAVGTRRRSSKSQSRGRESLIIPPWPAKVLSLTAAHYSYCAIIPRLCPSSPLTLTLAFALALTLTLTTPSTACTLLNAANPYYVCWSAAPRGPDVCSPSSSVCWPALATPTALPARLNVFCLPRVSWSDVAAYVLCRLSRRQRKRTAWACRLHTSRLDTLTPHSRPKTFEAPPHFSSPLPLAAQRRGEEKPQQTPPAVSPTNYPLLPTRRLPSLHMDKHPETLSLQLSSSCLVSLGLDFDPLARLAT